MTRGQGEVTTVYEVAFRDAFPPSDAVGHFVVALAAADNDLLLTNRLLFPRRPATNGLSSAESVSLLRVVLAQLWETHLLVQEASKTPEVLDFIERLGGAYSGENLKGADLVSALRGQTGAGAPQLRNLLHVARNATHHFPKPGDPGLVSALQHLRENTARIRVGPMMPDLRAEFADEVMWRLAVRLDEEADLEELMTAASESVIAVVHLAQTAIDIWFAEHGAVEV